MDGPTGCLASLKECVMVAVAKGNLQDADDNCKTCISSGMREALLEQAMIGPSPNPLLLSYLKYAISSQMVSYSTVLMAISKFDDFSRDLCIQSLLEIMDMFCDRLRKSAVAIL
ncbi:UNVERIFIED_CONTAM: hypothetical protein K2H54_015014 [Gekko kuhli]